MLALNSELYLPLPLVCWDKRFVPLYMAVYFVHFICFWICLKVRGQSVGVSSFFLACRFQRSSSGCQPLAASSFYPLGWLALEPTFELSGLCHIYFHVSVHTEHLVWACVWPLSLSSCGLALSWNDSIMSRTLLLVQHSYSQFTGKCSHRPASSWCANRTGRKCFTHLNCVTCWQETVQYCWPGLY